MRRTHIDLGSERLGGRVLAASDEFFAPKENLLKPERAVFRAEEFTERGKWMDGWETRRRRDPGDDWCIVRLGVPGVIHEVIVDTAHFRGNQPESFTVEACAWTGPPDEVPPPDTGWTPLVGRVPAREDHENRAEVHDRRRFTHVRLVIHPDGGVARFRVLGEASPDWSQVVRAGEIDLVAVEHGGVVVGCSDECFGEPAHLLLPGRPANMGEGWETRRRRGEGHDWVVLRLGRPGIIERIEVDTGHFKGNYPESCSLEGCMLEDEGLLESGEDSVDWTTILPRTTLRADTQHLFPVEAGSGSGVTHVRFRIFPDGGVGRLRLIGRIAPEEGNP